MFVGTERDVRSYAHKIVSLDQEITNVCREQKMVVRGGILRWILGFVED